ncbi:MAG: molybdenum cofactor guanylyltransferase [Gemmataceae bacterium]|nr:molybdenum cofactor guanylyltransferase [Gemmata sp.]MDW8197085.1 molybdenum cofactor guanylyltransferase [Gemmataceae bacterium]
MATVGGVVLCGGRSSRMGTPKAWLPIAGETLLARVVRVVGSVVAPVVVVAAPRQAIPPLPAHVTLVRDETEGCGPLAGLVAGLAALEGVCETVYVSACDVPFVKPDWIRRVLSLLGEAAACVPSVNQRLHPLAAAYRVQVLPIARQHLACQRFRLHDWVAALPTRIISPHEWADVDPQMRSLWNINTPEDYQAALRELEREPEELTNFS